MQTWGFRPQYGGIAQAIQAHFNSWPCGLFYSRAEALTKMHHVPQFLAFDGISLDAWTLDLGSVWWSLLLKLHMNRY